MGNINYLLAKLENGSISTKYVQVNSIRVVIETSTSIFSQLKNKGLLILTDLNSVRTYSIEMNACLMLCYYRPYCNQPRFNPLVMFIQAMTIFEYFSKMDTDQFY